MAESLSVMNMNPWEGASTSGPTAVAIYPGHRLFVQIMLRKWGSCNPITGNIRLNTQLAQKPKACLDYVLLHELCHLRVPRHGEEFVALLNQHMADWQERKQLLNRLPIVPAG